MNTRQASAFAPTVADIFELADAPQPGPAGGARPSASIFARVARWLRDDPQEARLAHLAAASDPADAERRERDWDAHAARLSRLPFAG